MLEKLNLRLAELETHRTNMIGEINAIMIRQDEIRQTINTIIAAENPIDETVNIEDVAELDEALTDQE